MNSSISTAVPSALRFAPAVRQTRVPDAPAAAPRAPATAPAGQALTQAVEWRDACALRLVDALTAPGARRVDAQLLRPALAQAARACDDALGRVLQQPAQCRDALRARVAERDQAGRLTADEMARSNDVTSDWDMIEDVSGSIAQVKENYLDKYTEVMNAYYEFYSDVTEMYSQIAKHIDGGDENTVILNVSGICSLIQAVIDKWEDRPILVVDSQAEAEQWQAELNLPYEEVDGQYYFYVDLDPLYGMLGTFNSTSGTTEWNTAEFGSWQTGFDGLKEDMQTSLQVMAEGYTQANSQFNEYVKLLIGLVSSLTETEKSYLSF